MPSIRYHDATTGATILDFNSAHPLGEHHEQQRRRLDDQAREELRRRAAEIVQSFLGKPNRRLSNARQLRWGRKGSFALNIGGRHVGLWADHETETGGDIVAFLQNRLSCSTGDAIAYALDYLGPAPPQPSGAAPRLLQPEPDDEAVRIGNALHIWLEREPLRGSLAETYLAHRGIVLRDAALDVLGYNPFCRFGFRTAPALLGLIVDIVTGEPLAVHRRRLTVDGRAADVPMSLGPKTGGAIKLAEPDQGKLAVGEGLETCLSGMQLGYGPAWSLIDAGGLSDFPVLDYIDHLVILIDYDGPANDAGKPGYAGERAAEACRVRWTAAGKNVTLVIPDRPGEDMNDVLLKGSPVRVLTFGAE